MTLSVIDLEIKKRFSSYVQSGAADSFSAPSYVTDTDIEAPVWLNARCGGQVVGVDFVEDNGSIEVSVFFRSIQDVHIASKSLPLKCGAWCPFLGNKYGFKPAPFGNKKSSGCLPTMLFGRMVQRFVPPMTEKEVVKITHDFLTTIGVIA